MTALTSYLATATGVGACMSFGTWASDPNSLYYKNLTKPSWNPPNKVFPIVWTTLYTDIAVTSGHALARARELSPKDARTYALALGTNLVLNATWSYSFFRAHKLGFAALHAGALAVSSADLVRRTYKLSKPAGIALAPYAAWTGFATALSTEMWRLNR